MSAVEPGDKVVVLSGTGLLSKAAIMGMLAELGVPACCADNVTVGVTEPKEPKILTEREAWNQAVAQRKINKKAGEG